MGLLRFITVLGLLCCAGCSIKEDRGRCPCTLRLDVSEVDTLVVKGADLFLDGPGGYAFSDSLDFRSSDGVYEAAVPRGRVSVRVYAGVNEEDIYADGFRIPYGDACPPVYTHTSRVETSGESADEKVVLHKNHCVLTVKVLSEDIFPFNLDFKGRVNGYDADGMPVEGDFFCSVDMEEENLYKVRLPRQVDNSLMLEVRDNSGLIKAFAIGEYIDEAGYDWSEVDLRDMTIEIDLVVSQFAVVVEEWDKVTIYDVVI